MEVVLGARLVEAREVDALAPFVALLLLLYDVGEPCRVSDWFDESSFQQVMHFGLGCLRFFVGHFLQPLLFWAHRGVVAQTMFDDGAADPY
jgi:hypothetical protein